ncbi:hypothetical protein ACQKWADRAFT_305983 [Trichoderma austrokoningii]
MTAENIVVAWKDANGQTQNTNGLSIHLYMDMSTTNTAFFKLYANIFIRANRGRGSKRAVYLFIYPKNIQAITLSDTPSQPTLSFSLTTQPSLVAPRGLVLESRPKTAPVLDSIRALATVVNFTVSFHDTDAIASTLCNLKLVASVFSPTCTANRPSTDERSANLQALYKGKGGEIVRTNEANDAEQPPAFHSEAGPSRLSNKRRREASDLESDRSPSFNSQVLHLLQNICARLDIIDTRIGRLEDKVTDSLNIEHTPCRYDTEERTEILETVDNKFDDCITDLKIEADDVIKDIKDEVDENIQRLDNESKERFERLEDEIEDNTEALVKKHLKEKLSNASLRVDGTVFLDI